MADYEVRLHRGTLNITKTEGDGKDQKEDYATVDLRNLRNQLPALIESRKILKEMLGEIEGILREVPTKPK
jgi:hypothetical protein